MALFIHFKFKVMGELLLTFFSDIHTKNSCHTFTPYFLPIESIPCVNFYTGRRRALRLQRTRLIGKIALLLLSFSFYSTLRQSPALAFRLVTLLFHANSFLYDIGNRPFLWRWWIGLEVESMVNKESWPACRCYDGDRHRVAISRVSWPFRVNTCYYRSQQVFYWLVIMEQMLLNNYYWLDELKNTVMVP